MISCQVAWNKCVDFILSHVSEEIFDTWFKHISPAELKDNVLVLKAPSDFFIEWVDEHYSNILSEAVKNALGFDAKIKFIVGEEQPKEKIESDKKKNFYIKHSEFIKNNFLDKNNISGLNKKYSFDNFIEGDCNQLARSSALSVSNKPLNNVFNPLMIYSNVGLGKTHLLNAIGNSIEENFNDKIVFYMQATVFANQFIKSIQNNNSQAFINFYSEADVLLLDDIQLLKDKNKTQEILFYVFNQLHQNGKQIVLSSDRPPNELVGLQDRLVSRFKWGLTVNLTTPNFETRIGILRSKITDENCKIDDNIIEYIARRVESNVRELEGVMLTAMANVSLEHILSIESIQKIINNISKNVGVIDMIINIVTINCNLSPEEILSKGRNKKNIALARQIIVYFANKYTNLSLKKIGELVGGRDHSTVSHAINTVKNLINSENNIKKTIDILNKEICKKIKNF